MLAIVREANCTQLVGVAKLHKLGKQAIYTWRKRPEKLGPADVARLRELEAENVKPRKLVAKRDLEIDRGKWRAPRCGVRFELPRQHPGSA